jgi:hypothetical protein
MNVFKSLMFRLQFQIYDGLILDAIAIASKTRMIDRQ